MMYAYFAEAIFKAAAASAAPCSGTGGLKPSPGG
jgi:hypothetical protein